jgi:regulator of PEP synthase PpsR (kinase-PPPase family)
MGKGKRKPGSLQVVILTGGSGRTADSVLKSALAQFESPQVEVVHATNVRTSRSGAAAIKKAAENGAVVCHSLVDPKIREAVVREAEQRSVPLVDILGPVITLLSDHLGKDPRNQPGLSYALQKKQFDLYTAVDFTLAHDDGSGLHDLHEADVVLVGVSRTCKSVTCFYLAHRGIKAANVPLIPGHELPVELQRIDPERVIGLTMNAQRLSKVREARATHLNAGAMEAYIEAREIIRELRTASRLMADCGWRSIDVSYLSVEEVAAQVLVLLGQP